MRRISLISLLACSLAHAQSTESSPAPARDALHELNDSLESITRKVSPAVVKILVSGYGVVDSSERHGVALIGRQRSLGSGVIVDAAGYVVTNAHVIQGSQRIRVLLAPRRDSGDFNAQLTGRDRVLEARVVGASTELDLAVLKVEAKGLPTLPLAPYEKLRQGQLVFAFGSPEGLENSVTMGVVSSVLRQPDPDKASIYIQTDAAINPGNSGGPLVDVDGNVVGLNTFIFSESGGNEGIGFAIPSKVVRSAYLQLRRYGHLHRGEIGASVQAVTPDLATALRLPRDTGILVSDVVPGSPAEAAGLQMDDIVLAIDGKAVVGLPMFESALSFRVDRGKAKLDVVRGDAKLQIEVAVVERPHGFDKLADRVDPEKNRVAGLGIIGIEIDKDIASLVSELRKPDGVIVAARTADPGVSETGLAAGDVIHALNRVPIATLEGLREALGNLHPGDPVALQVERDGKMMYLSFELE
jgi:serine protease Do